MEQAFISMNRGLYNTTGGLYLTDKNCEHFFLFLALSSVEAMSGVWVTAY